MVKEFIEKLEKVGIPYIVQYFKIVNIDRDNWKDFEVRTIEGLSHWVEMERRENPPRQTFAIIFMPIKRANMRAEYKIEEWNKVNGKLRKRSYTLLYDGKHWKEIYEKGSRSTKKSVEWMN